MKFRIFSLLRPSRLLRAWRFRRDQGPYDRSKSDLELQLYSKILTNDMLHYGFFDDAGAAPENISIADMEAAQVNYARLLLEQVSAAASETGGAVRVLDAGCGMGGLTGMLIRAGFKVEALTPNRQQADYIREKYPELTVHQMPYEAFISGQPFDVIIHSESLQYIPLGEAFSISDGALRKGGRWIISDYFRLTADGASSSGHLLEDFYTAVKEHGWNIHSERDITRNVLPTLRLVRLYADRFLLPLKQFGFDKFRVKQPFLYDLTGDIRQNAESKLRKELAAIDPGRFINEKKYLLFVLGKP